MKGKVTKACFIIIMIQEPINLIGSCMIMIIVIIMPHGNVRMQTASHVGRTA